MSHNVNFTYDGNGLLIGRSIGGSNVNYTFVYEGDRLIRQTYNNTTHTEFLYGKEGLIGFIYNEATYLYQKNIFGDIVKVVDSAGQVVAEYSYTAFGECTIVTNVNNIATEVLLDYVVNDTSFGKKIITGIQDFAEGVYDACIDSLVDFFANTMKEVRNGVTSFIGGLFGR